MAMYARRAARSFEDLSARPFNLRVCSVVEGPSTLHRHFPSLGSYGMYGAIFYGELESILSSENHASELFGLDEATCIFVNL